MRRLLLVAIILCASAVSAQVDLAVTVPTIDPALPFGFRIDVDNNSGAALQNVTVNLTIPAGLQVTAVPAGCSKSAQTVSCLIPELPFSVQLGRRSTLQLTGLVGDALNGAMLPMAAEVRGATGTLLTNTTTTAQVY